MGTHQIRADDEFIRWMNSIRQQLAKELKSDVSFADATRFYVKLCNKNIVIITRKSKRRQRDVIADVTPYSII
jgi:GTP-sensing pleiotropic transcriptional regulator CodY